MRIQLRWFLAGPVFLVIALALYRWEFPYGRRSCFLPCTLSALRAYAADNNGWFPQDDRADAHQALAKLSPEYLPDVMLAGLSGDLDRFRRGTPLTQLMNEANSSWVYQTGFRWGDPPEIALIWDKEGGVKGNGERARKGDHYVGFVDGEIGIVRREEWLSFTNQQAELKAKLIANRAATNALSKNTNSTTKPR